ncbi:MAG: (Fe-S)-binding protein [Dehalococcoidia bacterium]|nr:(Fe-S)-binding protein [Dehalococcoidia bacterium]
MSKSGRGLIPPGLAFIADKIHTKNNILGIPGEDKAKWAAGLEFSKDNSTIFFAGCGYQFSAMLEPLVKLVKQADKMSINHELAVGMAGVTGKLGIDATGIFTKVASREKDSDAPVLRDAVKVLQALGVDIGYLGKDEPCCGAPLYHMGLHKEFHANAEKAHKKFKSHGVKSIIGVVPSCTYALRDVFSRFVPDHNIEVRHFIDVVAENIGSHKFKYPHKVKVVYHDPCQLGRYMGHFDQPRKVLNAIEHVELVETQWTSGQWSTCCGGGGGFEVVFPDMSHILAEARVKELLATEPDIIATHCPGCLMQLRSGLKQLKNDNVQVVDLATLLAASLPKVNTK